MQILLASWEISFSNVIVKRSTSLLILLSKLFSFVFLFLLGSPKIRIKTLKVYCLSLFITMHIVVGISFHFASFLFSCLCATYIYIIHSFYTSTPIVCKIVLYEKFFLMVVFNICIYNYVCNNACVCVCVFNVCVQFYVCAKKWKSKWLCVCVNYWIYVYACVWVRVILSYASIFLSFHFFIMETFASFLVNP